METYGFCDVWLHAFGGKVSCFLTLHNLMVQAFYFLIKLTDLKIMVGDTLLDLFIGEEDLFWHIFIGYI